MNVVVKKSALQQLINRLAEERGYHSRRLDQIAGDDKPVMPDAQIPMQLSVERLPVENPDFLPVNKRQLNQVSSQIADAVPPDKVQNFYSGLKKLLRKTAENDTPVVTEAQLIKMLRTSLREARGEGRGLDKSDQELASQLAAASAASTDQTNIDLAQQTFDEPVASTISNLKSSLVGTINRLVDEFEKKNNDGEHFKSVSDYQELVNDLSKPESFKIEKGTGTLAINAGGVSRKEPFRLYRVNPGITSSIISKVARDVANEIIDDVTGSRTSGGFLGDPNAPVNRPAQRYGTLALLAEKIASTAFAQLGDALPEKSVVSETILDDFVTQLTNFVTTQLDDNNKTFSYNVQEDINSPGIESKSVSITLNVPDSSSLPQQVRSYKKTASKLSGVQASDPVNTMDQLKASIVEQIEAIRADILAKADDKLAKKKAKGFTSSGEGRNFASDILRRFGGRRSGESPEKVRMAAIEMGKERETDPMNTLIDLGVLDEVAIEMRNALFTQFKSITLNDIIDDASKTFEDSDNVFETVAAEVDNAWNTKGGDVWDSLYTMFKDTLKSFGEMPDPTLAFFKTYQRIISNPKFKEYVDKKGGTYRSDMFERSKGAFFDSETTLVGNLMLIRKYLLATGRARDAASLVYRDDDGTKIFPVADAFGAFLGDNMKEGEKDYDDLVKKMVKLIKETHPEYKLAKAKKEKKDK
jgi:hypothetical protein